MSTISTTEGIVLRKIDYSETSVIVSIFTFDYGLTSFMVRGDRKMNKKHSPQFDVLRVVNLNFEMKPHKDLQTIKTTDVVKVYTKLGSNYRVATAAQWLCRFLQSNLHGHHESKALYAVFRGVLERLDHQPTKALAFAEVVGFTLYFLIHEGILPEDYLKQQSPHLQPFYDALFKEVELPELTQTNRIELADWLISIVHLLDQKCIPIPDCLL